MSTTFPESSPSVRAPTSASRRTRAPSWLREPLLHFVILGGVLFGADHFLFARSDDPRTIVIDAAVDREARHTFAESHGREPNEDELYALRGVWLDNEVLYREGIALQLDKGDPAIHERVIFKALSMIDAGTKLPPYDDDSLRAWFEQNRARYDEPARYDFQEGVLAGGSSEGELRAFADALNAGAPGRAEASLRVFTGRPRANLVQSYGEEFADTLEVSPPGEWRALRSTDGLHVVRLDRVTQPQPAVFEDLRGVALQDWTDATLANQRTAAVRALAKKYTVKTGPIDGSELEAAHE